MPVYGHGGASDEAASVCCIFLLALACIKPQNVGLFLLVLLLKKQWKILFTTGGMVLGGWGASLLYVKWKQKWEALI